MRWVAYALLALCQLTSAAKKKTKSFEESTSFSVKFINEVDGLTNVAELKNKFERQKLHILKARAERDELQVLLKQVQQ